MEQFSKENLKTSNKIFFIFFYLIMYILSMQVYGSFIWPHIGEYTGFWKGDKMEGEGTYKTKDGEILVGQWKNSKLHGQGERRLPGGDIYIGEWVEG